MVRVYVDWLGVVRFRHVEGLVRDMGYRVSNGSWNEES